MANSIRYEIILYWSKRSSPRCRNWRAAWRMGRRIRRRWRMSRWSSRSGSRPRENWAARYPSRAAG